MIIDTNNNRIKVDIIITSILNLFSIIIIVVVVIVVNNDDTMNPYFIKSQSCLWYCKRGMYTF